MKVLVTGSSGFIGKRVVDRLSRGPHQVLGVDRIPPSLSPEGSTFESCDLLDQDRLTSIMRQFQPEGILHLAARTDMDEKKSLEGYAANSRGVENLLQALPAVAEVRRVVFTSTQLVCRVGYVPKSETDYCPHTLYGQSKVLGEKIVREQDGAGKEWCLARPTTIWGPGMRDHYVGFFRMIQRGKYFHTGSRPLLKSYGYVGNTAYQFERLLLAPKALVHGKTFYLADYTPLSLRAWADSFQSLLGGPRIPSYPEWVVRIAAKVGDLISWVGFENFPFTSFRLNNILTEYIFNLENTREVCGELPFQLNEGIAETVKWLQSLESFQGQ